MSGPTSEEDIGPEDPKRRVLRQDPYRRVNPGVFRIRRHERVKFPEEARSTVPGTRPGRVGPSSEDPGAPGRPTVGESHSGHTHHPRATEVSEEVPTTGRGPKEWGTSRVHSESGRTVGQWIHASG